MKNPEIEDPEEDKSPELLSPEPTPWEAAVAVLRLDEARHQAQAPFHALVGTTKTTRDREEHAAREAFKAEWQGHYDNVYREHFTMCQSLLDKTSSKGILSQLKQLHHRKDTQAARTKLRRFLKDLGEYLKVIDNLKLAVLPGYNGEVTINAVLDFCPYKSIQRQEVEIEDFRLKAQFQELVTALAFRDARVQFSKINNLSEPS